MYRKFFIAIFLVLLIIPFVVVHFMMKFSYFDETKVHAVLNFMTQGHHFLFLILFWFVMMFIIYLKYNKEYAVTFSEKYYKEVPGDYTPAEMSILINFGTTNFADFIATILDLVRKKQFTLEQFINAKGKEDYKIGRCESPANLPLKKHELFLIEWFTTLFGDFKSITISEIKNFSSNSAQFREFQGNYKKWQDLVEVDACQYHFFDKKCRVGKIMGITVGILFVVLSLFLYFFMEATYKKYLLILILGFIMIIYSATIRKRSPYGQEQFEMLLAFKRFLKDFTQLDKSAIGSIVLFENYLVYAISIGVAKDVVNDLPIVFNESELSSDDLNFLHFFNSTLKALELTMYSGDCQ